jgi:sorting nexin-1/2
MFLLSSFQWEGKVERGQEDFEKISETIRKEISRFDKRRVKDFQQSMIKCLESLMETQQKVRLGCVYM